MALGVVGKKIGMTRIFDDSGASIPVTVVQVLANRVTQLKSTETDGYHAIQVACGHKKPSRLNASEKGLYAKSGVEPGSRLKEFTLPDSSAYSIGDLLSVDLFSEGQFVDVAGTSKGKGFAGVVKRWNFRTQDATHGNSLSHRAPGSIGQNQTPGRVFKGKKMSGQMGNVRSKVQSLKIVKVDTDKELLLIRGSIPGAAQSDVIITPATKVSA